MDRSKRTDRAGRSRDAARREDDLAPGRSTLTERLEASASEPSPGRRSWPDAALIDQGTAAAHGLVQFDPAATPDRDDPQRIHAQAAAGMSGPAGALPHGDAIQRSFGKHDVSGVLAHVGGPAAEASAAIGANAYASGDRVAFARAPDLRLAAHETAHVVQQRGGVRLDGGVGRGGDSFEQHADAVADAVVRGESAEALLDPYAHRGAAGGPAVQRHGEGTEGAAAGTQVDPARDQQRAQAEAFRRATIGAMSDETLTSLAGEIDAEVMNPPATMGPRERAAKAQTLVAIYRLLQQRMAAPRGGQEMDGDALPSSPAAESIDALDFERGSPLAGILDDIAPFGNYDQWCQIARSAPREEPAQARPARPAPGPQPGPAPQPQPEAPARPSPTADATESDLRHDDIAPQNVEPSTAGTVLDATGLALDLIGLIVTGFLFEACGAIIGPVLDLAGVAIALEEGVENHERAGRAFGIRATLHYCLFTSPAPQRVEVEAVLSYTDNSTSLNLERARLISTGISAGGRINAAIREGMTRGASAVNRSVTACEADFARRLTAQGGRAPTAEERQQLRRQVYQAIADRMAAPADNG